MQVVHLLPVPQDKSIIDFWSLHLRVTEFWSPPQSSVYLQSCHFSLLVDCSILTKLSKLPFSAEDVSQDWANDLYSAITSFSHQELVCCIYHSCRPWGVCLALLCHSWNNVTAWRETLLPSEQLPLKLVLLFQHCYHHCVVCRWSQNKMDFWTIIDLIVTIFFPKVHFNLGCFPVNNLLLRLSKIVKGLRTYCEALHK